MPTFYTDARGLKNIVGSEMRFAPGAFEQSWVENLVVTPHNNTPILIAMTAVLIMLVQ